MVMFNIYEDGQAYHAPLHFVVIVSVGMKLERLHRMKIGLCSSYSRITTGAQASIDIVRF